jgi:hypothetical protein
MTLIGFGSFLRKAYFIASHIDQRSSFSPIGLEHDTLSRAELDQDRPGW